MLVTGNRRLAHEQSQNEKERKTDPDLSTDGDCQLELVRASADDEDHATFAKQIQSRRSDVMYAPRRRMLVQERMVEKTQR